MWSVAYLNKSGTENALAGVCSWWCKWWSERLVVSIVALAESACSRSDDDALMDAPRFASFSSQRCASPCMPFFCSPKVPSQAKHDARQRFRRRWRRRRSCSQPTPWWTVVRTMLQRPPTPPVMMMVAEAAVRLGARPITSHQVGHRRRLDGFIRQRFPANLLH